MIIKSYLVFPVAGSLQALTEALQAHPSCTVVPSTNQDVIVLATEAEDEHAEKELEAQLRAMPLVQALTLVSGHNEDGNV